jgi:hypothetical protein
MIGIVMGVPTLRELFDEKYYTELEGGILESFGRLFKNAVKVYVYPFQEPDGTITTASNMRVAAKLRHLYAYLLENRLIEDISPFERQHLPIFSKDVLSKIKRADPNWEQMVPPEVADLIKRRGLFGYGSEPALEIRR